VPARDVTMIGASALEASDETWGLGLTNQSSVLVRYTSTSGWERGPALLDAAGQPLSGFRLDQPADLTAPSPLAGQVTADGSGVLVGDVPGNEVTTCAEHNIEQVVLVRNPGGAFRETAPVPSEGEAALQPGECLFGLKRAPLIASLEEGPTQTGALLVPVDESGSLEAGVLHWDGSHWTREPIEIPSKSSEELQVLAIGASSPSNAWLLAKLSSAYGPGAVALFRRHPGEGGRVASWQPVAPAPGAEPGEPLKIPVEEGGEKKQLPFTVPGILPQVEAQILTVTAEGVWIDGERSDARASATMFFKPEGEGKDGGSVVASWCKIPASAPAGTAACEHELPEALPTGPSRSIAWANPSTPGGIGERVITGFREGVSLRLDGTSFTTVLALGGGPVHDPGREYGAAFSNPREGWLGDGELPVHLTLDPVPSRLSSWPVSFRHALLAIAPQPGAPVGSLSSVALAVGDQGEVARYEPSKGWMPESLLGAGGRLETPRLRAVAWPTPTRAYAVGDLGQMWLWRGETGLWEPDPATPYNFRGDLLGIAFDPNNPARGYAVGSGGVLLGYGKTWTQEQLPASVQGASFTSIAFAGSEAIVAYRKLLNPSRSSSYIGGLLINDGSGWQVDQGAAAAMGSESKVPEVVAGLPDGGAAFVAESFGAGEGGAQLFERSGPEATWQPAPTPLPRGSSPGSLALFREGSALRAIAAGSAPNGFEVESVPSSPPGFPPPLIGPYPLAHNAQVGVLRQTANGWSDEEHELNDVTEPEGNYSFYDTVYQPDPIWAVLVDPTGTQGWAVGGFVDTQNPEAVLDTADVDRYPADGVPPPGVGSSPVSTNPKDATFAIGGNAQCSAPCADRARARVGPQAWLSVAVARAGQIAGVRAFLDTGPGVTAGVANPAVLQLPYASELKRYAEILGSSPIPAYAAPAPTELDGNHTECAFAQAFEAFPAPFGGATPALGELRASRSSEKPCSPGSQAGYYAWDSTGPAGSVRVIVLDDSGEVDATQQAWLGEQLNVAKDKLNPTTEKSEPEPAIVIGNADLNAQISARDASAAAVTQILLGGSPSACVNEGAEASAYFYDAPEENVRKPLRACGKSIESFGSGTLGYVDFNAESSGEFLGASGFLLAEVNLDPHATRTPEEVAGNRWPIAARLIPNIGELAIEARDGTLLRRSQTALFDALARRVRAGNRSHQKGEVTPDTDPYIPIPSNCVGTKCANGLFPEYVFSSSRSDIGDFVTPNLAAEPKGNVPLLGSNGKPIPDPESGLFCAYNAGTTIVTISAGGLSSSLPVTIQAGSVREPCGTQPLKELPSKQQPVSAPPPAPAPAPAGAPPASAPPPVPLPPAPAVVASLPVHATPAPRPPSPPPFFPPLAVAIPQPAFVPPPLPPAAQPTPPSGTSAVTSPVQAVEREEEEEEATESVANQALAYRAPEHEPAPLYILGVVVLAAFAGASARRRPRGGRRELRVAPATLTTMRAQRRMGGRR
jgi:hypothetical protein